MYDNWEELENSIVNCKKCKLCTGRRNIVFGEGNKEADLMFIGEGPGADEDKEGIPFVGRAGQLMNKAFQGLGIDRSKVYIANVVKCRPPGNRVPEVDEAKACLDYLRNQVILVKPKIIVLLGSTALKNILGNEYGITATRGNVSSMTIRSTAYPLLGAKAKAWSPFFSTVAAVSGEMLPLGPAKG